MEQENPTAKKESLVSKHNRVKRIKITIIVLIVIFLILPTILCIILFFNVLSLQKQIDMLMIERYGVTYNELFEKSHEGVAHAAVVQYNTSSSTIYTLDEAVKLKIDDIAKVNVKMESNNLKSDTLERKISESKISEVKNSENKDSETVNISEEKYIFDSSKTVYLTFDDGPSKYTADILDMLDTYNVKATFFVIGKTDKYSKEMYKRIVEEGHSLGIHSFSHVYDKIYNSLEDFEKDFTKLSDLLYDTTGYIPYLYRFPGGSGNSVSKVDIQEPIRFLDNESIVYFDWNVVNGDATGIEYSPEELYNNVMNGIKIHNTSIVLMHDTDTKGNTVKSLEIILKTLTEQNVNVLPLTVDVTPIKQVK